ncbi:hypothetical protein ACNHKD_03445 [Methylocystis sp. JAN1]|uniref:hypothetical protein n=1 Tax=Methylocystis sp. JAN1 TaxID=3397211 RepID=UPI003FA27B57
MTTESRVEEANRAMAEIANDVTATHHDRRERLQAVWVPVVHALVDNMLATSSRATPLDRLVSNPDFVGVTCDSRRRVFLDKAISECGLVYRKFVIADEPRAPE